MNLCPEAEEVEAVLRGGVLLPGGLLLVHGGVHHHWHHLEVLWRRGDVPPHQDDSLNFQLHLHQGKHME